MPFQIRMGVPEMEQLWLDLSTRSLQGGLDKEEEKFFKKLVRWQRCAVVSHQRQWKNPAAAAPRKNGEGL